MKTATLVVIGLVLLSGSLLAGEYLINNTGNTVRGLRVVFSEPVSITGYGDVLMSVTPSGESTGFIFTGGELGAWSGHWLNWEPEVALIVGVEWLTSIEGLPARQSAACHQHEVATQILSYVPDPDISYYHDGDRDWDNAQFWELPGYHVRDVVLEFAGGNLTATVSLDPDDMLGQYCYHIEFRLGDKTAYINLDSANRTAELVIATLDNWDVRATYTSSELQQTPTSIGIQVPLAAFADSDAACRMPIAAPSFHMSYSQAGRRELFFFPTTAAGGVLPLPDNTSQEDAPLAPVFDAPMRGVHIGGSFTYWNGANNLEDLPEEYFFYLESLNVDWVGIGPAGGGLQDAWDTGFPGLDVDEELVRRLIRKLHQHGFSVYVMVSTWFWHFGEDWPERANLGAPDVFDWARFPGDDAWPWASSYPRHELFVEEFFQSYTREIVKLARLCEEESVEMLALGTETDWLFRTRGEYGQLGSEYRDELRRMTYQARQVYSGLLTYDMVYSSLYNSDLRENSAELWGDLEMDVIGLSMYPQLFETRPTGVPSVEDLKERWQRIFDAYFVPLRKRYPDKPIVFTEFGFINAVGTTSANTEGKGQIETIIDSNSNGIDDGEEEQANAMAALFEVMEANPGVVEGVFIWGQWIQTVQEWSETLANERNHWVRGRLAQKVICEYYGEWGSLDNEQIQACCTCPEGSPVSAMQEDPITSQVLALPPMLSQQQSEQGECTVVFPSTVVRGGHYGHIRDISFNPDGSLLATAGYDQYCRLYSFSDEAFTGQAFRHPRLVMGVQFSPNGRLLATAGSDQLVRIWDIQENELIHTLVGHPYYVRSVSFSPDGSVLASAGSDSSIRIWDVATGQELTVLWDHVPGGDIAFSPTGEHLVGGSYNGAIHVWDAESYEHVATLEGHEDYAYTVAFSEEGNMLATGELAGRVKLWSWPEGSCLQTLENAGGWTFALDPTGSVLVSADYSTGRVGVWQTETGRLVRELQPSARVMGLAFAPDGKTVTASLANGQLESWNASTGERLLTFSYHTDFITGVSTEHDLLITASWDGLVLRWNGDTAEPLFETESEPSPVLCLDLSPSSRLAAIGREDGSLQLVDTSSGAILWSDIVCSSGVLCATWIADGSVLAWASNAGNVGTVEPLSSYSRSEVLAVGQSVFTISQSPMTEELALGLSDGTVVLVTLSGMRGLELQGHSDSVYALAFNGSGDLLYSAGRDGTVRAWDLETGSEAQRVGTHEGSVYALTLIESLGVLVSASADTTLKVWDLSTGACVSTLRGHSSGVTALDWDEERGSLIAGGKGDLMVWDPCVLAGDAECPEYTDPRAAMEYRRAAPQFERESSSLAEQPEQSSPDTSITGVQETDKKKETEETEARSTYFIVSPERYPVTTELAIDGMSEDSIPLNWWYTFDETDHGPEFHSANPITENTKQVVRYTYPDDGNVGRVVAQFAAPVDVSSYEALILVAKADRPVHAEVELSFFDCNLHTEEDDEPCGGSSALFSGEIPLRPEAQVIVIPIGGFAVHPWIVDHVPGASAEVDFTQIYEFKIALDDECALEIYRVAFAETITRLLFDERHDELNTLSIERALEIYPEHPEWRHFGEFSDSLSQTFLLDRGLVELSDGVLARYDALVISAPRSSFISSELEAIRVFIEDGGGMLVLGDAHLPEDVNSLLLSYGVALQTSTVCSREHLDKDAQKFFINDLSEDHPITAGLTAFRWDWGCALSVEGDATILMQSDNRTWLDLDGNGVDDTQEPIGPFSLAVAMEYGLGRIVVLADNPFIDDLWTGHEANRTFLMRAIEWLLGRL